MPAITRRALGGAALAVTSAAVLRHGRAAEPLRLRCSLDTAPSHGRNISLTDYLHKVEQATSGRIKGEVFSSGQLFPDLKVGMALIEGQVEMACPGSWTITGIVPDADVFQLPVLYGRSLDDVHTLIDGAVGARVDADIHTKLRSQVIGNWLDLGYQSWYSAGRPLTSLADLKGMKIRNSGGAGQAWRARFVGAIPNTTAWPDVPLALSQGTFDGLVSTDESLATAKLWEAGVKYGYADRQFVGEYIPMVSLAFWNKLTPDEQKIMTGLWAQNIPTYRENMAAAQTRARQTLEAHNVKITDATPQQIADERQKMMADQDQVAKQTKLSPEIVKLVMADAPKLT